MLDASAIPADARLYLLPTQFAATPVGRDGEVVRVAGGLTWCAAFDLIAVSGGRRVVQATVKATLPKGFQTSEFLLKHGYIDRIVRRADMKSEIARVIDYCGKR